MEIDYDRLEQSVKAGTLRIELERELETGFRAMIARGEPIPPATYLATKIAEIVSLGAGDDLEGELAFDVYQEVAAACENAREKVLGEPPEAH